MKLSLVFFLLLISACVSSQERIVSEDDALWSYPYNVNYMELTLQQEHLKMAFMDIHPAVPERETIVLLHGKNFNGAYWQKTIDFLVRLGYRVIVPDQIGFGKSSLPLAIQYSFQQMAASTKKLLDSLNIKKVTLLGHSMGGMLAIRFSLMFPSMVEKVILEDPIGLAGYDRNLNYVTVDELYERELTQDFQKIKEYQLANYYHDEWRSEYDRWAKMLASKYVGTQRTAQAKNSARQFDMIYTQPVAYELANIKPPVFYVAGKLDRMTPGGDELKRLFGEKKDVTIIIQDGIGHLPHIESFSFFTTALSGFLK
jgi:pimeloyl-ACP methyl ester carboxylesterase